MGAAEKIEQVVIDVGNLVRFPLNPRKVSPDDPKVRELAEDLRQRGQLTEIIVRTVDDGESWEVLAGERRMVAAPLAGLATLRAVIRRDLERDEDALAVCLAENLQREDIAPIDEADALGELLHALPRGATIATLASRVGKSEGYVRERLLLRGIVDEIRALASRIDVGALNAIASSSSVVQGKLAKRFVTMLEQQPRITRADVARVMKTENVMRSLKVVSWDLADAELVPEAGACNVCKKRTGQGALVDDVVDESDVCLDDECFAGKGAAAWDRLAKEEREQGTKVLSQKESARVIQYGRPAWDSEYVALEDKVYTAAGMKKASAIVNAGDAVRVVAQDPETKAPVHLFLRKDVDAAVKRVEAEAKAKEKADAKKAAAKPVDPKVEEARRKEREAEELRDEVDELVLRQGASDVSSGRVKPAVVLLRIILDRINFSVENEEDDVAIRRGLADRKARPTGGRAAIEKLARGYAKDGKLDELLALEHELLVAAALRAGGHDLKKDFGIDPETFKKEAMKRIVERKLAAAAPKAQAVKRPLKGKAR